MYKITEILTELNIIQINFTKNPNRIFNQQHLNKKKLELRQLKEDFKHSLKILSKNDTALALKYKEKFLNIYNFIHSIIRNKLTDAGQSTDEARRFVAFCNYYRVQTIHRKICGNFPTAKYAFKKKCYIHLDRPMSGGLFNIKTKIDDSPYTTISRL